MRNITKIIIIILFNIVSDSVVYAAAAPYKTSQSIAIPVKKDFSIFDVSSYYSPEDLFQEHMSLSPILIHLFFHAINQNNQHKVIKFVKQYPLLLATCNNAGMSALIKIFEHFDFLTIRYVVGQGIGLNIQDDVDQKTPLMYAIQQGNMILFRLLLEQGKLDIDLKDRWQRTALHYAVLSGDATMVQLLLELSPDISQKDSFEKSALNYAHEHNLNTIEALLQQAIGL